MAHQTGVGLLERGHEVTLFAKVGSQFPGALVMPPDAKGYVGEVALAREAMRAHRRRPFDVFLDMSHVHKLAELFPDLPTVNVYHDIYQPPTRCMVLLSEGQRALMSAAFEHAMVIPNALDIRAFQATTQAAHPPYALFVGALSEIKQPMLAVEACARMGINLVLAGAPLTGSLPITQHSNVEYYGPITADQRNQLMQGARVFLQLGTVESFGLTTLEAMLCGTPVVAWPAGGSLDLIEYGVNGVFVPLMGADMVGNVVDAIERAWDMDRLTVRQAAEGWMSLDEQLTTYEQALIYCARGRWW